MLDNHSNNISSVAKYFRRWFLFFAVLASSTGCTSYNAFEKQSFYADPTFTSVQVERGRKRPLIDATGRFLGLPNQIALGNSKVDNHQVSQQTETEIVNYLEQNELGSVLVRSNQYAPLGEFKRTLANDQIRPVWKSTFGAYNLLKYTLLPGRLVGGDWYNPYSNSLHVYSDTPELVVVQASYARDLRTRLNPGAYAAVKDIPLAGLSHETTATQLALEYYEQQPERADSARQILYPNYGASVGGQIASFIPYGNVAGRIVGGGLGRLASEVKKRR